MHTGAGVLNACAPACVLALTRVIRLGDSSRLMVACGGLHTPTHPCRQPFLNALVAVVSLALYCGWVSMNARTTPATA